MKKDLTQSLEVKQNLLKIQIHSQAVFDDANNYIYHKRLYYAYFAEIPSKIIHYKINDVRAIKYIETEFSDSIQNIHLKQNYQAHSSKLLVENAIYVLSNKIMVDIERDGMVTILYPREFEFNAMEISNRIKKFKKRVIKNTEISILIQDSDLRLVDIENKKPKLVLNENYNDDLVLLHKKLITQLNTKKENGLILFHGPAGTGKSTYLRHLINLVKKRVIFLSPNIAGNLSSPNLMRILMENQNSILIIEDAEDLLVSRERENNSAISMLLNLTDGLLGASLGIQVICTFNTQLTNIDKALLRKGRLKALYKFEALSIHKSKLLLDKVGAKNRTVIAPMTIAEIYNMEDAEYKLIPDSISIGFKGQIAEVV